MGDSKKDAVNMGVTLSTQLISASLTMIAVLGAFATFIIDKREIDNPILYYILIGFSFVSFVASIICGGKGIDIARKFGYFGKWRLNISKSAFNRQAVFCIIGIALFIGSIFFGKEKKDKKLDTIIKIEKEIYSRILHDSLQQEEVKKLHGEINLLKEQVNELKSQIKDTVFIKRTNNNDTISKILAEGLMKIDTLIALFKEKSAIIIPFNKPDEELNWIWLILIVLSCVAGIILCFFNNKLSKIVGLSLTASSILGITIDKLGFELNLDNLTFNINQKCDSAKKDTLILIDSIEHIGSIGPFTSGDTSLLNKDSIIQFHRLQNNIAKKEYSEIFIFGGVDKRPLKRKSANKYGDNLSLAQARANKVADSIEQFFKKRKLPIPTILTFPKGAKHYGSNLPDLDNDRFVKIYGKK
ncbi:MAG: hypothetical protein HYY40_14610 [Bacteroidetes bacterium]|nr:hypothetical protein [Bacteroidota bacterium]